MEDKRTSKQVAKATQEASREVNIVLRASTLMKGHKFFNHSLYTSKGKDEIVKQICDRYQVDEKRIRKIVDI